jgi:3-phenylpropionate/trans-cinnamate dioxygenase ferredoxin subunit
MKVILAMINVSGGPMLTSRRTWPEPPLEQQPYSIVTTIDRIAAGCCEAFEIAGHAILICHTHDGFYAVENRCSHAAAALDGGRLRGVRIICPLHGASFDVRDGRATGRPATLPIRIYPLRIRAGRIEVLLPAG